MIHKDYMEIASRISMRAKGNTAPNPHVGAIIVKDGVIIARGWTGQFGLPHAEVDAINKVKNKKILKGSTLYCTLEPCSHFGKTSPCVDYILKNKIKNVFIAGVDKNKIVNGSGLRKLKNNKVNVKIIKSENSSYDNKIFFHSKNKKKPFITLKVASSADGKIATSSYKSKWITSELSRLRGHMLRVKNDCILVGSNTLIKDDPKLNSRLEGLEKFSPDIFILDRYLKLSLSLNIFKSSNKIFIFHSKKNLIDNIKKIYSKRNIFLHYIESDNELIDIRQVIKKISDFGYQRILIEGGSSLAGSLLLADLIDKIFWFRASKLIGGDGLASIANLGISDINSIKKFKLIKNKNINDDTLSVYEKE